MEDNLSTQLAEMGFPELKIKAALVSISPKSLENALEWISSHEDLSEEKLLNIVTESENKMEEEPKGQPISGMVNQEMATLLKSQGFTEAVAEKALFFTQNVSVEKALEWIDEHKSDPDYLEPLFIVATGPTFSKEEAIARAKELQRKLREKRAEEEKKLEHERELNRIRGQKELNSVKRLQEEAAVKRELERQRKERLDDEMAKRKILEDIEREKAIRFGKEYKPKEQTTKEQKPEPKGYEKFLICLSQMETAHPENLFPGMALTAFKTLKGAIDKIIANPAEDKFKRINTANPNVEQRLGKVFAAYEALRAIGFLDENEFLVFNGNMEDLKKASAALNSKV